jgi:hypothetical protein
MIATNNDIEIEFWGNLTMWHSTIVTTCCLSSYPCVVCIFKNLWMYIFMFTYTHIHMCLYINVMSFAPIQVQVQNLMEEVSTFQPWSHTSSFEHKGLLNVHQETC